MLEQDQPGRRGHWQLLMLMLLPISIVLLATFVYYTRIGLPDGTRNKGELVSPPLQINALPLRDATDQPLKFEAQRDVWSFVVMFSPQCDDFCRQQIWETRQTRTALGKYQNNIQRVWLVAGGKPDIHTLDWLTKEHGDMKLLYVDDSARDAWLQGSMVSQDMLRGARFFLVDPRGFLMMRYTSDDTYKDVITDMKFLLKGVE